MNKLLACLISGALLCGAASAPLAQETVTIGDIQATRVVIAPARSAIAQIIKAGLTEAYYGPATSTRAHEEAQRLYFLYGARHFEPLWLVQGADGQVAFSPSAEKLIAVFQNAAAEGFRPSDYLTPDLDITNIGTDPTKLSALETAFSASALRYAHDAYTGRITPSDVSVLLDVKPKQLDQTAVMTQLATSDDPAKVLLDLDPIHPEFLALKAALANFDTASANLPVAIPEGPVLKPGMTDERVALLRTRFELPVPTDGAETIYDDVVVEAVKGFQESLGLDVDGVIGPATIAALNGGSATTKEDIIANMERWRWMPRDLGKFNVFVNIPEFRLAVMKDGEEVYTTRVVVGTTAHQTPIFSDAIRHIVVNPYWNVPSSIIRNEIAPKVRANPGYIASQNMELLYNGSVVSASQVNWSAVGNSFPFSVRQKPGKSNALGAVKFLFPNSHDVYLHDTPSKGLFGNSYRAYSHGCVRVQNPMEFADALLANEPGINAAALEAMYGPKERWVNLDNHVPVHLAYFTLRVAPDGSLRNFGDVYGHNKKLMELLAE